jgi:hypothetical protein
VENLVAEADWNMWLTCTICLWGCGNGKQLCGGAEAMDEHDKNPKHQRCLRERAAEKIKKPGGAPCPPPPKLTPHAPPAALALADNRNLRRSRTSPPPGLEIESITHQLGKQTVEIAELKNELNEMKNEVCAMKDNLKLMEEGVRSGLENIMNKLMENRVQSELQDQCSGQTLETIKQAISVLQKPKGPTIVEQRQPRP